MGNKSSKRSKVRSKGPTMNVTEEREIVLASIKSALHSHLGDEYHITIHKISDDGHTAANNPGYNEPEICPAPEKMDGLVVESGDVQSKTAPVVVSPNPDGTNLVYLGEDKIFSLLYMISRKADRKDTRFLFVQHIVQECSKWNIGSPYVEKDDTPVGFKSKMFEDSICKKNVIKVIEDLLKGIDINHERFVWKRTSTGNENFQVTKTITTTKKGPGGKKEKQTSTLYWKVEDKQPTVKLTDKPGEGCHFGFVEIPEPPKS